MRFTRVETMESYGRWGGKGFTNRCNIPRRGRPWVFRVDRTPSVPYVSVISPSRLRGKPPSFKVDTPSGW